MCLSLSVSIHPSCWCTSSARFKLLYARFVLFCNVLCSPVLSQHLLFHTRPLFYNFLNPKEEIKAKRSITKHLSLLWTYDHKISRDMRFNDRRQRCILYFLWVSVYRENHPVHSDEYSMPLLFANQFYQIPSVDIFDRIGTSYTGSDLPAFRRILLLLSAVRTTLT